MKKITFYPSFCIGLVILFITDISYSQSFTRQTTGITTQLDGLSFSSENVGFASGESTIRYNRIKCQYSCKCKPEHFKYIREHGVERKPGNESFCEFGYEEPGFCPWHLYDQG